ncbi:hypothetical protein FSP39_016785 [Pinctada imbricata]|uniref:Uncharacterized protein n=1 Tax=Pinctada imbricata TaxID=66713 RepID=A0AA88XRL5_PINIB|nr:hypothetical protein FSP39_016785 [Pinctada imbricata]
MNDFSSVDSSSPRSFDPRTPRSEPRSPWTFTGSTRIDLRDVIKETPRDRIHRRGDSDVHAQYRDVTAEIIQRQKALRINDDKTDTEVKQPPQFQTPGSPSSDVYAHRYNGLTPRGYPDEELSPPHYRDLPITPTPYPDYETSRKEPISVRSDAYNTAMYRNGIDNMNNQSTRLRNGNLTDRSTFYSSPRRNDNYPGVPETQRSALQRSLSPPPDYIRTHDDPSIRYDNQNPWPPYQQIRQSRREHRKRPSIRSSRSKSAPPGTVTKDGRMLFDPTKNKQLWTKWRIEATERIIQETKNRNRRGTHQKERFGRALAHPPPGLARLIDVTQSTRQRACTLMDSGDRGTTSELLTKQFIYFGVPRVTLKTSSVHTTNS